MKFLLDESADARLRPHLVSRGHDVAAIALDHSPGLTDQLVLAIARQEARILITDDRDFAELVFRHRHPHQGVIYLRLGEHAELPIKLQRIDYVLAHYGDQLDQFLVVTRDRIRVRHQ